jgi:hypothetical protein
MLNPKEFSLRREVIKLILYGFALFIVSGIYGPYLGDTFRRWTTPDTWQPSYNVFRRVNEMVAIPMMFTLIACLLSLPTLRHGRNRLPWITIRVSVVAVMFVMFVTTATTIAEGQKIWDRKILEQLAPLRVGMPRSAVEAFVLQTNMLLLGKPSNSRVVDEYRLELTYNLDRAQRGEIDMLDPRNYRGRMPGGLFYQANWPKEQARVQVRRRYGNNMADTGAIDTLNLRFDSQDRLESAVYQREQSSRGSAGHCEVIFQRPATNLAPCDPTPDRKI